MEGFCEVGSIKVLAQIGHLSFGYLRKEIKMRVATLLRFLPGSIGNISTLFLFFPFIN
jgi:UPF0716 family protein affecting phage T7 exclusion